MISSLYHLVEIFASLQGEGRNAGRPATFIRFAGCNLSCSWCDTDRSERFVRTLPDLVAEVEELGRRSVIITGGEPTVQPGLDVLLAELKKRGFWIALETNGLVAPSRPDLYDYIATSPKANYADRYVDVEMIRRADEVRIVSAGDQLVDFCESMRAKIAAMDYYISPLAMRGRADVPAAISLINALNERLTSGRPWALSIQTHKVLGLR